MNQTARPLILVGGGGHCKSVIEAAESAGLTIRGIIDTPAHVGETVCGYKVIDTDEGIPSYVDECDFIITLGFIDNPSVRRKLERLVEQAGGKFGKIEASSACVSPYSTVGEGTVILHNANVNAGATVGRNCIINTASNVEHDVVIGDNVHVSTGAMVNGDVRVGDNTFIGSGAVIFNGVTICENCVVGAGSVVNRNLTIPGTYVGIPARRIYNG